MPASKDEQLAINGVVSCDWPISQFWIHNVFSVIPRRPEEVIAHQMDGVYGDAICIFAALMEKEE